MALFAAERLDSCSGQPAQRPSERQTDGVADVPRLRLPVCIHAGLGRSSVAPRPAQAPTAGASALERWLAWTVREATDIPREVPYRCAVRSMPASDSAKNRVSIV